MSEEVKEETVVTNIPEASGDSKKQAYIIFLSGPLVGKIHLLEEGAITLGRGDDATIMIADLGISRHHLSLICETGKTLIKDMGSTNGTYVNGQRVKEYVLKDGDKIQISSSTIMKFAYQDNIENIFHKELYKMAIIDALTGAYNKRFFEGRLKEEFSYCLRNSVPLSLLIFDIDYFKKINDTYGHRAGDFVLTHLATLARSIIRTEDIFCRYGGEEFTVLLKGTDEAGGILMAERLRRLIEESDFTFDGQLMKVTISLGVTTLKGQNFTDSETMIKLADKYLYKSKNNGRNRSTAS
ncbi:MAG: GGDEF domain-containing protein [Deltaproteobacteria bacterium]|nr:GGDEF domain-containing protein [Deltaproteobacteria bacterium]